jgi:hypothetical protein
VAPSNCARSAAKKVLDFSQDFCKTIDLGCGVVKVETGARGGFDTQFAHERLVAVVSPAQGNASLVGNRYHVVSVHIF